MKANTESLATGVRQILREKAGPSVVKRFDALSPEQQLAVTQKLSDKLSRLNQLGLRPDKAHFVDAVEMVEKGISFEEEGEPRPVNDHGAHKWDNLRIKNPVADTRRTKYYKHRGSNNLAPGNFYV